MLCAAQQAAGAPAPASSNAAPPKLVKIDPRTLPRLGEIDARYQSYNIEMVEVTGGRFWKPYDSVANTPPAGGNQPAGNQPAGMSDALYEYRPPIDLTNARLRKLATALGPAYLRVSGTWANTTWLQSGRGPVPSAPPAGFKGILTRDEWKGVVSFAKAVDAGIVTSFAVSDGTRDAKGVWTPAQAHELLALTRSAGGSIAAAEFMNEPTFPQIGGAPKDYDAAAFARDLIVFHSFLHVASPKTLFLGPGGVGEGSALLQAPMKTLKSSDLLAATGPVFDGFSFHVYGAVSARCGGPGGKKDFAIESTLSENWLQSGAQSEQIYEAMRDELEPGKPLWLTETAEAACGGDRWASTFADTFRYLNQLGAFANRGVQVHLHNTLAASDYGLLDEKTYEPRPDYWAALLWHKLMGTTVLEAGAGAGDGLHVYAHCLPKHRGGVSLLVIISDTKNGRTIDLPVASDRYTLIAPNLMSTKLDLNGAELKLGENDALPLLDGSSNPAGAIALPPESISFFEIPGAKNASCMP